MMFNFFTLDIVGYDELEGHAFSNTNHFELVNVPCDTRVFQSHKYDAHIEFYSEHGLVTLTTFGGQAKVEFDGKVRTWNNFDVLRVQKHLWKILGKYGDPAAELILPVTEPPNDIKAKGKAAIDYARKLFSW